MNHIEIIKRSWKILWSYRALWVFGIILALTSGGGPSGQANIPSGSDVLREPPSSWKMGPFEDFGHGMQEMVDAVTRLDIAGWIMLGIAMLCVLLLLAAIGMVFKYLSRTALIRMVDHYEKTGEKVNWREGFRLGWNRAAFRLFLIDLALYLPLGLVAFLMIMCPALPLIMAGNAGREPSVVAIVAMIGFAFLTIFLLFIVGVLLSLTIKFIRRECVLGDANVLDSIRQGWDLVRSNFVDVFLMGLILVGIGIGLFIVMLPLIFLLLGVGVVAGGGLGFALYAAINTTGSELAAIISAVIIGMILFITIMAIPLTFIGGLGETFYSTIWTLAYREVKPFGSLDALPSGDLDVEEPTDEEDSSPVEE